MNDVKVLDLFGGIGGFHLGLDNASERFETVDYIEFDEFAVDSYNAIYDENYEPRDVTKVDAEDIKDFDILCGGFPCQSFSIAGDRGGFEDTRGTLFFQIVRLAKEKKPKMLLLENVKGLLSHQEGLTFAIILKTLNEIGYYVDFRLLNSKYWGVPQNRERVFIPGFNIRWAMEEMHDGSSAEKSISEEIAKSFLIENVLKEGEKNRSNYESNLKSSGLDYVLLKELDRILGRKFWTEDRWEFLRETFDQNLLDRLKPKKDSVQGKLGAGGWNREKADHKDEDEELDVGEELDKVRDEEVSDEVVEWLRSVSQKCLTGTKVSEVTKKDEFTTAEMGLIVLGFVIDNRNRWNKWTKTVAKNTQKVRKDKNYEKRRETEGIKASFNLRRDFYPLGIEREEIGTGFDPFSSTGKESGREVLSIGGEDEGDSGQDGREVEQLASRYGYSQNNSLFSKEGLSPTLNFGIGGPNQFYVKEDSNEIYTTSASYIRNVILNSVHEAMAIKKVGDYGTSNYSKDDVAFAIPVNPMSDREQMVYHQGVVGRNEPREVDISMTLDKNYFKGMDNYGSRTHIIQNHRNMEIRNHGKESPTLNKKQGGGQLPMVLNHQFRPESRPSIEDGGQSGGSGLLYNGDYSYALSSSPHYLIDDSFLAKEGELRVYDEVAPTQRGDRFNMKVLENGEIDRVAERWDGKQAGGVYNPFGIAPMVNYGKRGPMPHHVPVFPVKLANTSMNGRRVKENDEEMFSVTASGDEAVMDVPDWLQTPSDENPTLREGGQGSMKKKDHWDVCYDGARIRKLTPRECWRLQGFPDWSFDRAREVNSDTQLYKQAGNAVSVPVIKAIGEQLIKYL